MQDRTYYHCSHTDVQESEYVNGYQMIDADHQGSDYKDDGSNILLDANENAYGPSLQPDSHHDAPNGHDYGTISSTADVDLSGLHRYPDPYTL